MKLGKRNEKLGIKTWKKVTSSNIWHCFCRPTYCTKERRCLLHFSIIMSHSFLSAHTVLEVLTWVFSFLRDIFHMIDNNLYGKTACIKSLQPDDAAEQGVGAFRSFDRRGACSRHLFGYRDPGRNHVYQIWWWSVKVFLLGGGPKFAFSHWLWWSSL